MLVDLESLTVKGVVDWDMCTLGNPLYELAILLLYWRNKDDPSVYDILTRMPFEADGWMPRREVIKTYLEQVPFELSENELRFYVILALYRSPVVLAQLQRLYTQGIMKSTSFTQADLEKTRVSVPKILRHTQSLLAGSLSW